jgi:ABC-type Mn2+/Zn2+ transport system ATPase subunit
MMTFPYRREPCHGQSVAGEAAVAMNNVSIMMPGDDRPALEAISMSVAIGSRVALVGPNGAGKSTLLKALVGLLKPRSGSIQIYGKPVGGCLHRVAYLPQRGEIDWRFPMTVRTLVGTGRYVHLGWFRRPGPAEDELIRHELERLRLVDLAERQIGQLSGGQQQRTMLARSLVQSAELLLLDEPTNAVDAETRRILMGVLDDLRSEGKTVIIATHDLDRLDSEFDDVVYLVDGQQVEREQALPLRRERNRQ